MVHWETPPMPRKPSPFLLPKDAWICIFMLVSINSYMLKVGFKLFKILKGLLFSSLSLTPVLKLVFHIVLILH